MLTHNISAHWIRGCECINRWCGTMISHSTKAIYFNVNEKCATKSVSRRLCLRLRVCLCTVSKSNLCYRLTTCSKHRKVQTFKSLSENLLPKTHDTRSHFELNEKNRNKPNKLRTKSKSSTKFNTFFFVYAFVIICSFTGVPRSTFNTMNMCRQHFTQIALSLTQKIQSHMVLLLSLLVLLPHFKL